MREAGKEAVRPLKRRLYIQLSAGFLFLLTICCIVFVLTISFGLRRASQQSMQTEYRSLAARIAARIEPLLSPRIDAAAINREVELVRGLNPFVELFLVSADGRVRDPHGQVLLNGARVSVETIAAHLADTSWNPARRTLRHPTAAGERVFSAAPLLIENEPGYLLLILRRHEFSPIESRLHLDALARGGVIFAGLLTLLTAAIGLFVLTRMSRNFYELLRVVREFERGKYAERCEIRSRNELGELAGAVNAMAATIEQNIYELESKDELRRRLVANISHDLRAPIAGIVTLTNLLHEHVAELSKEEIEERFLGLITSGEAVTKLVDELFELSKLEAKEVTPKRSAVEASELLNSARARFLGQAQKKGLTITCTGDKGACVYVDPVLLARVFDNLLANAIRHSHAGGAIVLSAEKTAEGIRFSVADRGEGIEKKYLEEVFKPYHSRGDTQGMGLGLAIVTEILRLHDSTISVESVPGKGSQFSFFLPECAESR